MTVKQAIFRRVAPQFGHPRGPLGHLAGWIMGARASNRERSRWAVSLLDIEPTDRVLEIGFGPGLAIESGRSLRRNHAVSESHLQQLPSNNRTPCCCAARDR